MLPSTSAFKDKERRYIREPKDQLKICISTISHVYYIDTKDIVRIQSISNYSKIYFTSGKTMIVSKVLAYFDTLLTGSHFVRIHRTHLVNLLCIRQYVRGSIPKISLNNDEILPVSRSRKKILQQEMRSFVRA